MIFLIKKDLFVAFYLRILDSVRLYCPTMSSHVRLLTVKGNLRHRIELLGLERESKRLSFSQRRLRDVADAQGFRERPYERPSFASGAFVYLTPAHALCIERVLVERGESSLQSKHILVSDDFFDLVKDALSDRPVGRGREAFLIRRSGIISSCEIILMKPASYSWAQLNGARVRVASNLDPFERLQCAPCQGDKSSSYYDDTSGKNYAIHSYYDTCQSDQLELIEGITLLQLSTEIMKDESIDEDLREFMSSTVLTQELSFWLWIDVWVLIVERNRHLLEMCELHGPRPLCRMCCAWASAAHLITATCESRQLASNLTLDPLLRVMLKAERERTASKLTNQRSLII